MNTKSSGKFTKFPKKFETSYVFPDTINRVFTNLSEKQSYNSNIPSECKAVAKNLLKMPTIVSNNVDYINGYDLFGDGLIYILNE